MDLEEKRRLARKHYTLKKLLLKLTFTEELKVFMVDPSVRHQVDKAPVLYRAYQQGTKSPLFPHEKEEDRQVMEQLVESLPRVQVVLKKATKRDLAGEIRNSICNSWCSVLATRIEMELAEEESMLEHQTQEESKERERRRKEDFYVFATEEPAAADDDEEDSSSDELPYDPMGLDPALASRRKRRRALAAEMTRFMHALSVHGMHDFIDSLAAADTYQDLRVEYHAMFTELFNLLTLTLLDSYSQPQNRKKATGVLSTVPQWILSVVFKLANPFKLMVYGAKVSVTIKTIHGHTLLQSMLRTLADIDTTEKRLKKAQKKLSSADAKALNRQVDKMLLEGRLDVSQVNLEEVVSAAGLERRSTCLKAIRLELRRREKQALVDWAATPEAKFIMLQFMPLLGRPILEHYKTGSVGDHMKAAINALTALIEAIEIPMNDLQTRKEAIDTALDDFVAMVFNFFKDTAQTNRAVIEAMLGWMMKAYSGGPELLDLDELLQGISDERQAEMWQEVDDAIVHLEKGGHHAPLELSVIRSLVPRFQEMLSAHLVNVPNLLRKSAPDALKSRRFSSPVMSTGQSPPSPGLFKRMFARSKK